MCVCVCVLSSTRLYELPTTPWSYMESVKGSLYFYEQYIYNNVQQEVSKKKKKK